ncbi:unnamed protein product [Ectocarpus sp. 8 AP-2014]
MGLPDGCLEGALGGVIPRTTATVMLAATGKLVGLNGIVAGFFSRTPERGWKVLFLSGFIVGDFVAGIVYPDIYQRLQQPGLNQNGAPALSILEYVVAGFLVGLGAELGNGCTSGHGLCGLSRLSRRSIVATLTFLTSGIATASVMAAWNDSASGGAVLETHETPVLAVRYVFLAAAAVDTQPALTKREERAQWKALLMCFLCGGSFAGGLVVSGMTKRVKIVNFLQLSWDPTLLFVLGFGVMACLVGFPLVTRRLDAPLCRLPGCPKEEQSLTAGTSLAERFDIATDTELDVPLVLGSWLFGIGLGLSGLCHGPAVVSAAFGLPDSALAFMPSLVVEMRLSGPLRGAVSLPHPRWVTGGKNKAS